MRRYIRFGAIPLDGKSKKWKGEELVGEEEGLSVWRCIEEDNEYSILLPYKLNQETFNDLMYQLIYDSSVIYLIEGNEIGIGNDGEPLLSRYSIIKELTREVKDKKVYITNKN